MMISYIITGTRDCGIYCTNESVRATLPIALNLQSAATLPNIRSMIHYIQTLRVDEELHWLVQCNQAREQNFFISEFEPILTHKIKSVIDNSLKFGTNLL